MWKKISKTGKIVYCERFVNPMTGKKRDVSVTYPKDTAANRREAAVILTQRIDQLISESMTPAIENMRLDTLMKLYLQDLQKNVKESTYVRNEFAAKKLTEMLGPDVFVDRLTAQYVRNRLLESGKSSGTLNEFLARFKSIMRWAYKADLIKSDAFLDKLDRFPDVPHHQKISDKFMETEELQRVLAAMQQPLWKLLTQFLALSGLRIGEAMALTMNDIDEQNKLIIVSKTYSVNLKKVTSPKTEASWNEVIIQPELESLIKSIKSYRLRTFLFSGEKSDLLFPGSGGGYIEYASYSKYLRETTERVLGRRLTPHSLRHTHASLLFEQGFTLEEVSRRLRHSKSNVTRDVYIHVTKKLREKDAQKLSAITLLS